MDAWRGKNDKVSLLICTPMFGGKCEAEHFQSCLTLKEAFTRANFDHDWLITTNESLITRGRDTCAATFLKTDYERLLFIDADIEFNVEDVEKLWKMDCDVAVGAYRMKVPNSPLTAWKDGKLIEIDGKTENFEVDYAGTGFMMIKKGVFEEIKRKYPHRSYTEGHVGECFGFFQDPISKGKTSEDRFHYSEDYFFCETAKEFTKIMLNPTIDLKHWGRNAY